MKRITALYERERTVAHVLATYHSPSPKPPNPSSISPLETASGQMWFTTAAAPQLTPVQINTPLCSRTPG